MLHILTEEKKAERVKRAKSHAKLDRLRQGSYVDIQSSGDKKKLVGCSVGCDAIDILRLKEGSETYEYHKIVAEHYNTPVWLEKLRDSVFESLGSGDAIQWHVDLAEALPVGVDLDPYALKIRINLVKAIKDEDPRVVNKLVKFMTKFVASPGYIPEIEKIKFLKNHTGSDFWTKASHALSETPAEWLNIADTYPDVVAKIILDTFRGIDA